MEAANGGFLHIALHHPREVDLTGDREVEQSWEMQGIRLVFFRLQNLPDYVHLRHNFRGCNYWPMIKRVKIAIHLPLKTAGSSHPAFGTARRLSAWESILDVGRGGNRI